MIQKMSHVTLFVNNQDEAKDFYINKLGMVQLRRTDHEQGRFTLVYLAAPEDEARAKGDKSPELELTYNWDPENYTGGRNFGHMAFEVKDVYAACRRLMDGGVTINRPPRDGRMAFVRSPDGISIELLQAGEPLAPAEPWASMPNIGAW